VGYNPHNLGNIRELVNNRGQSSHKIDQCPSAVGEGQKKDKKKDGFQAGGNVGGGGKSVEISGWKIPQGENRIKPGEGGE